MQTTLAERIAIARKRAGLSQEDLATAVGLGDRTTVSKWEKGVVPDGKFLLQLPGALDVTADWLLLGVGDPKLRPAGEAERILAQIRELVTEAPAAESDEADPQQLAEAARVGKRLSEMEDEEERRKGERRGRRASG